MIWTIFNLIIHYFYVSILGNHKSGQLQLFVQTTKSYLKLSECSNVIYNIEDKSCDKESNLHAN